MSANEPFIIATPAYQGVDLLDVCAPVEVFGVTFDEVDRVDLLWVPGGDPVALKRLMKDNLFLDRLRA